jgi:hypothetical protein
VIGSRPSPRRLLAAALGFVLALLGLTLAAGPATAHNAVGPQPGRESSAVTRPLPSFVAADSVWSQGWAARGLSIEKKLGGNLPASFPTIDRFENGVATSIKSVDLSASTYQSTSRLTSTLTGYVNKVAGFDGAAFNGTRITAGQITSRGAGHRHPARSDSRSVWRPLSDHDLRTVGRRQRQRGGHPVTRLASVERRKGEFIVTSYTQTPAGFWQMNGHFRRVTDASDLGQVLLDALDASNRVPLRDVDATSLRDAGYDARSVQEIGIPGASDAQINQLAGQVGGRVLTRDVGHDLEGGFGSNGIVIDSRIKSVDSVLRLLGSRP